MALIYYSKHNNQGIMFISNAYISNISSQAVIFSIKKTKYQLVNGAAYGGVWGGTTPPSTVFTVSPSIRHYLLSAAL